ncbi:MAG: TfoX/Sxy family protein [Planctomycetota bacterium]|jgi:TfoX/Sxy family transcriptional regulator of competence genes|nr:TfoX/Sxy family protein [Planctomycetota bacterium]
MAYNERLAESIRSVLHQKKGITERKMFGGIAFMLNGNMFCGIVDDKLMLRLGNAGVEEALEQPHTRPMDFTGRVMKSMLYVDPEVIVSDADVESWVVKAVDFAATFPPK